MAPSKSKHALLFRSSRSLRPCTKPRIDATWLKCRWATKRANSWPSSTSWPSWLCSQPLSPYAARGSSADSHLAWPSLAFPLLFIVHIESPSSLLALLLCCGGRSIFCGGGDLLGRADVLLSQAPILLVLRGCPPALPPTRRGQRGLGGERWCREPVCLVWPLGLLWCRWIPRTDSVTMLASS